MIEVLDAIWFGTVGICRCRVTEGMDTYVRYYIGNGTGSNEEIDREYVSAYGSTFPTRAGDMLFGITAYERG